MSDKTNVMPNNLEAEQALLGCMIIDNDILAETAALLDRSDFYQESHRFIISAIKKLFESRRPIDIVTLCDQLDGEGNLDKAGGISYITELAQITPSAANYKHYLEIVKRDSINRSLIRAAREIADFSRDSDDARKSVQNAEKIVYGISTAYDSSELKDIRESDAIERVMNKFQLLEEDKDAFRGVPTGFTRLDKLTNGLQKSDLIVIAARPGMGKTSLAMNIVENAAVNHGLVCAVFSLEMPEVQIVQRLLCSTAGVSMADALSGKLDASDWKSLGKASAMLHGSKIIIDDSSRVTPSEILSKCRRIKSNNGGKLDLVMIDYIQLMSSGNMKRDENRTQEVASITRDLKIMAKELNVPVIALSQLRRIQSGEPSLSDLRESGAIEQDADIVMFINRPDLNAKAEKLDKQENSHIVKGMAELIVAKHRNGDLDRIPLRFRGELTKFVNPERDGELEARVDNRPPRGEESEPAAEEITPLPEEVPPDDEKLPFDE